MTAKKPIALPLDPLGDLLAWWKKAAVRGMIIGGLAVGLHGRPRVTRDVDAVIDLEENRWAAFLKLGKVFHLKARVARPLEVAREYRVLLLRHGPSKIDVDIAFAGMPFEFEALDRAEHVKVRRHRVPLTTVEDLIILKAIAQRRQDLDDVASLLELHPNLDRQRVLRWLKEFAEFLEAPSIYRTFDKMLKAHDART